MDPNREALILLGYPPCVYCRKHGDDLRHDARGQMTCAPCRRLMDRELQRREHEERMRKLDQEHEERMRQIRQEHDYRRATSEAMAAMERQPAPGYQAARSSRTMLADLNAALGRPARRRPAAWDRRTSSGTMAPMYRNLQGLGQTSDTPRDRARALYDSGRNKYIARNFAGALSDWQTAYQLASLPAVLISIAQAFEKLNRKEDARSTYQRYLWADPNGEFADRARAGVARNTPGAELSVPKGEQVPGQASISDKYLIPEDAIQAELIYAEQTTKKVWIATGVGLAVLLGVGLWAMRKPKPVTSNRRRRRR